MGIINHRKVLSESVVLNMTDVCTLFCDPTNNTTGFTNCLASCFNKPPPDVTVHHKSQKLQESLIISLSLIGLACLIFCLFAIYKYIRNKRLRPLQQQPQIHVHDHFLDEEQGPIIDHPIWYIRTVGLPSSTIDSITVIRYKRGEGLVEGSDCSVCLSEFQDDETLRLLPKCSHAFHVPCIDTWLRSHTNCPMCRAPIVSTPNGTLSPVLERHLEEDSQVVVNEGSEERERENLGLEPKDVGSSQQGRGNIGIADTDVIQPMRRSVSMDSLAASRLSGDITAVVVAKRVDLNHGLMRFVGGSSFRRSLQKGPVLMKRSFSCGGKVFQQTRNLKHSQ